MVAKSHRLHVVLFPFPAYGHMIPILDIAKLFTARYVKTTIITTPLNAPIFTKAIETGHKKVGFPLINLKIFKFPGQQAGIPEGCKNAELALRQPGRFPQLLNATQLLRGQLERYLDRVRPDCLVADMFYPWATNSAAKFNVPRLVFHGYGYFALSAQEIVQTYEPYQNVSSDDELFTLPLIPDEVKFLRSQIPQESMAKNSFWRRLMDQIKKSEVESYGVIVNSFYEVEPQYAEFFRKDLGRRAWQVGPVSLNNRSVKEKAIRGKEASINEHECLTWLNSKKPNSVIYICFGSASPSNTSQLYEIAMALQSSANNFIWVMRNGDNNGKNDEKWLPSGFEEKTKGRVLIIRGWAPQSLILEHKAIGAFVTHCGWNSILEGISAGIPMVTWPIFAEQFYNEKLVTDILKNGVSVGVKKWSKAPSIEDLVSQKTIEMALRDIMEGEKAEEMRLRAKGLKENAWKAVAEGGSSYSDMTVLINELRGYHSQKLV